MTISGKKVVSLQSELQKKQSYSQEKTNQRKKKK